jgi:glycerol-3-phosphate acyltransferase PlsY
VQIAWAAVGAAIIWIAHADNIDRLLHGRERKFDLHLFEGERQGG